MISTSPGEPHDSQSETRTQHAREEAAQSMATIPHGPDGLAIRLLLLANDETYCRDEWSASVCRQAAELIALLLTPTTAPAAPMSETIAEPFRPLKEERGLWDGAAHIVSGWRPIESAPKDWTTVILYSDETREVFAGYFAPSDGGLNRWEAHYSTEDCSPETPTHWMPLPPAPTPSQRPKRTETATGNVPAAEETR